MSLGTGHPRTGGATSVGVVGAGVFGVTAALELAARGIAVTLYERRADILEGATARNFFRLHRGYHYPRDRHTGRQTRDGYTSFEQVFAAALTAPVTHHYAIAAAGSLTGVDQFKQHCDEVGLAVRPVRPPYLVPRSVEACFEVDEAYYDARRLRAIAWERLRRSSARVELSWSAVAAGLEKRHDVVVVAAYGSLNRVLRELGQEPLPLRHEICEVPVVHAPGLHGCSLVVLDGPFISVAPYGSSAHILYDVANSVHRRATGARSPTLAGYNAELDGPPLAQSARTRLDPVLAAARRFIRPLDDVVHLGSLFSERVVLPDVAGTDARPTVVRWAAPGVVAVLSGKVSTAVDAARTVAREIGERLQSGTE